MSQGFTNSIPIPLPVERGGTGLIAAGVANNILVSDGTVWDSKSPLNSVTNYGLNFIFARGFY